MTSLQCKVLKSWPDRCVWRCCVPRGWTLLLTRCDTGHKAEHWVAECRTEGSHMQCPAGAEVSPGCAECPYKSWNTESLPGPGMTAGSGTGMGKPEGKTPALANQVQDLARQPPGRLPASYRTGAEGYPSSLAQQHQDKGDSPPATSGRNAAGSSAKRPPPSGGPGVLTWILKTRSHPGYWVAGTAGSVWLMSDQCCTGSAGAPGTTDHTEAHEDDKPASWKAQLSAPSPAACGSIDT